MVTIDTFRSVLLGRPRPVSRAARLWYQCFLHVHLVIIYVVSPTA
jgi:hypothetical protein